MKNLLSNRKSIGNKIFILGVTLILFLNLNYFEWYQSLSKANYIIAAVVFTAVFLCYADFSTLIKDKCFLLLLGCNVVSVVGLIINKSFLLTALVIYSFSVMLYLSDKVVLSVAGRRFLELFIGGFFIYWTIDVKGYFKGYSTNFGGLVLIGGFILLIIFVEEIRDYYVLKSDCFLSKYPFYFIIIEFGLFIIAYKIIEWYQSRTATITLIVFGVLLIASGIVMESKVSRIIFTVSITLLSIIAPKIYILFTDKGLINDYVIFTKQLVSSRYENWGFLYNLLKEHPIIGNGTIYVSEGTSFREGLLDTCNGFLQIAVPNGFIVALVIYVLMISIIIRQSIKIKTRLQMVSFIAILSMLFCSSAESFIINQPFVMFFASCLFIMNSLIDRGAENSGLGIQGIINDYKACLTKEYRDRFIIVFCTISMITLMYLILGPLEIFYSNYKEFEFNTVDFILFFTAVSILITVISSFVLASLPQLVSTIFCVFFFAVGIGSYIQYMFINGDLVDEEGNFVLELNIGIRYYISVIVFILCIIVMSIILIKYKELLRKVVVYGSLALSAVMITAVISISVSLINLEDKPGNIMALDATDEFTFAKDENTIVLILDTFGRSVLNEELSVDSKCIDFLHDFTYFKNHDSIYCPTFPSLYHLLTEYEYSEEEHDNYEKLALSSDTSIKFFDTIHKSGYITGLYSIDIHSLESVEGYVDNVKTCQVTVNKEKVRKMLFNLSMYRYLPYNLKKPFQMYNPKSDTVAYSIIAPGLTNDEFYKRMTEWGMKVDSSTDKKFTFSHLFGVHAPILNDENCSLVKEDSVSRHQRNQGVLLAVRTYIDNLKKLGIYDKSTIIVMADHGEFGDTDSIFFVKKPFEEHEEMEIDESMITHHDFQDIIIESLR